MPTLTAPAAARSALASRQAEVPKPTISVPPRPGGPLRLMAKALKCTAVVDPAAIGGFMVPNGMQRVEFAVAVAEHGPESLAVVLVGRLGQGDVLEEAGISAQVKGQPKPAAP